MLKFDKIKAYIIKQIPEKHTLKDTLLYRLMGERLFAHELWKPTKFGVARGLAIGMFITLTPTSGVQMLLSGLVAYSLRANIPISVACAWVSNPFTAPIILPVQFKTGLLLGGRVSPDDIEGYSNAIKILIKYGKPYLIGSIATAVIAAVLSYILVIVLWDFIERAVQKHNSQVQKDTEL